MKSQPSLGENFGRYMAFEVVSTSGRSLEQRNLPMVDLTQHHGLKNKADAYGQARGSVGFRAFLFQLFFLTRHLGFWQNRFWVRFLLRARQSETS